MLSAGRVPMAGRGWLASVFGGAAVETFDQCDLDGDGKIMGRAEAEALRNHVVTGHPGLTVKPRQWRDPLVVSNVLFVLAALQWWRRGYRRQGILLFGCGVVCPFCSRARCPRRAFTRADLIYTECPGHVLVQASWVYHSSGEDQTHWSLSLDQALAYSTFAHTIVCTAPRLQLTSVPGLCGLIVAALLVYSIAVPLRGHHTGALCFVRPTYLGRSRQSGLRRFLTV